MNTKGNLYYAIKDDQIICYYAPLGAGQYLVVLPRIFNSDPIRFRYSIISEARFRKLTKGYLLQEKEVPADV